MKKRVLLVKEVSRKINVKELDVDTTDEEVSKEIKKLEQGGSKVRDLGVFDVDTEEEKKKIKKEQEKFLEEMNKRETEANVIIAPHSNQHICRKCKFFSETRRCSNKRSPFYNQVVASTDTCEFFEAL